MGGKDCQRVVYPLVDMDPSLTVPALSEALRDGRPCLRRAAAWALMRVLDVAKGTPTRDASIQQAIAALAAAVRDRDSEVRANAARALGYRGCDEAVPALLEALRDRNADVRIAAAESLGKLGAYSGREALEPLSLAREDKDQYVRKAAASALSSLRSKVAALEALKAPEEPTEYRKLVNELVAIAGATGFLSLTPGGAFDADSRHVRTRAIGERLNKLGGKAIMQRAGQDVASRCGPVKARELEAAWVGIGAWQ